MNNKIKINEIFRSIQGESTYAGKPCIFIRLTGCNLRCTYCDTCYAYDEGKEMTIKQIVKEVQKLHKDGDIIEITGGEPLLQADAVKTLSYLLNSEIRDNFEDVTILIETNGSILLPEYIPANYIMDWKLPSSGMNDRMESANLIKLRECDELKFIIGCKEDYEEMKIIITKYKPKCQILVSPMWDEIKLSDLAEWILKDDLQVRMQLQLHKIIWNKDKRGV